MDLGKTNTVDVSPRLPILNDNGVGNYSFMHKKKCKRGHAFFLKKHDLFTSR